MVWTNLWRLALLLFTQVVLILKSFELNFCVLQDFKGELQVGQVKTTLTLKLYYA